MFVALVLLFLSIVSSYWSLHFYLQHVQILYLYMNLQCIYPTFNLQWHHRQFIYLFIFGGAVELHVYEKQSISLKQIIT